MSQAAMTYGQLLVVDDEPMLQRLMSRLLGRHGYEVRCASNGFDAVNAARERRPDLILMDIDMPGTDGYAVCSQLQDEDRTAGIPVIFCSGRADLNDRARAFAAGGVDYVQKPFHIQEFIECVRRHVSLHTGRS